MARQGGTSFDPPGGPRGPLPTISRRGGGTNVSVRDSHNGPRNDLLDARDRSASGSSAAQGGGRPGSVGRRRVGRQTEPRRQPQSEVDGETDGFFDIPSSPPPMHRPLM